jgi:hypothetical protein
LQGNISSLGEDMGTIKETAIIIGAGLAVAYELLQKTDINPIVLNRLRKSAAFQRPQITESIK